MSFALSPQDWRDVEPFLDSIREEDKRVSVLGGYVSVPVTPTDEMLRAAWQARREMPTVSNIYAAMLAASPPAQQEKENTNE